MDVSPTVGEDVDVTRLEGPDGRKVDAHLGRPGSDVVAATCP